MRNTACVASLPSFAANLTPDHAAPEAMALIAIALRRPSDSPAARVWTLPPTYRLGALDHDKYAKVGGGENFLLKFRKVGGRS